MEIKELQASVAELRVTLRNLEAAPLFGKAAIAEMAIKAAFASIETMAAHVADLDSRINRLERGE